MLQILMLCCGPCQVSEMSIEDLMNLLQNSWRIVDFTSTEKDYMMLGFFILFHIMLTGLLLKLRMNYCELFRRVHLVNP